jgi:amidophosphoribosyltransferase
MENMIKATSIPKEDLCMACFDGQYPVPIQEEFDKFGLE